MYFRRVILLNTILSFTGDPLQTPLLGKNNKPHKERMAFVEQWAQLVKAQPLKDQFAADAAFKN